MRTYQYRYLFNDEIWLNDWHAEAYGSDNCQVTVEAES